MSRSAIAGLAGVSLLCGSAAPGGVSRRGTDHWFTRGSRRFSWVSDETGTLGGRLTLGADDPPILVAPRN